MRKRLLAAVLIMASAGLFAVTATTASATPSKTSKCSNCHTGAGASVTATLLSNSATAATYRVSAPGADAIAMFNGTAKVGSTVTGTSAQFTVPFGAAYTVYAVTGPGESDGIGSTNLSPTAPQPAPDTTAPVTTSDAKTTYITSAVIKLSATDNVGVANTYYILDGGTQASGTTINVSTLGSHTVQFWSTDAAGNAESRTSASFTISAAPILDTTAPVTTSDAKAAYVGAATVLLTAVDNSGGSGVAATYYTIDAGAQAAGTTIAVSGVGSHTIEFWSVDAAGNVETRNSETFGITMPEPVVDTTAPTTTSDAKASYAGTASITLVPADNAGGSGVAHTYFILDGAPQVEGVVVSTSVLGSHTLSFWSVDVTGNIETTTDVTFAVTVPTPVPTTTCTIKATMRNVHRGHSVRLSGTLTPAKRGAKLALYVQRPHSGRWVLVARPTANSHGAWIYNMPANRHGTYRFQVRYTRGGVTVVSRTVTVTASSHHSSREREMD